MRFLLRASIPTDAGNDGLRSGSFIANIQKYLAELKPEAVYFTVDNGRRTLYFVVEVANSWDFPRVLEPLWLATGADVEVIPAMTPEDFQKAAPAIQKALAEY